MKRVFVVMAVAVLVSISPVNSFCASADNDATGEEVKHDLEKTLSLWRDGRMKEVNERVVAGKGGREAFVSALSGSFRKPACCWEQLQEVKVVFDREQLAHVRARFGIEEPGTGISFVTTTVTLELEDGVWKVREKDLLSLAKAKKGKKGRKGKARKGTARS